MASLRRELAARSRHFGAEAARLGTEDRAGDAPSAATELGASNGRERGVGFGSNDRGHGCAFQPKAMAELALLRTQLDTERRLRGAAEAEAAKAHAGYREVVTEASEAMATVGQAIAEAVAAAREEARAAFEPRLAASRAETAELTRRLCAAESLLVKCTCGGGRGESLFEHGEWNRGGADALAQHQAAMQAQLDALNTERTKLAWLSRMREATGDAGQGNDASGHAGDAFSFLSSPQAAGTATGVALAAAVAASSRETSASLEAGSRGEAEGSHAEALSPGGEVGGAGDGREAGRNEAGEDAMDLARRLGYEGSPLAMRVVGPSPVPSMGPTR